MPIIKCRKCNNLTNTAVSDHIDSTDKMADRCYAYFKDEKWIRGCAFDQLKGNHKILIEKIIFESV